MIKYPHDPLPAQSCATRSAVFASSRQQRATRLPSNSSFSALEKAESITHIYCITAEKQAQHLLTLQQLTARSRCPHLLPLQCRPERRALRRRRVRCTVCAGVQSLALPSDRRSAHAPLQYCAGETRHALRCCWRLSCRPTWFLECPSMRILDTQVETRNFPPFSGGARVGRTESSERVCGGDDQGTDARERK